MTTKVIIDKLGKKPMDIDALHDVQLGLIVRVAVQQLDAEGEYSWDRELTIRLHEEEEEEESQIQEGEV